MINILMSLFHTFLRLIKCGFHKYYFGLNSQIMSNQYGDYFIRASAPFIIAVMIDLFNNNHPPLFFMFATLNLLGAIIYSIYIYVINTENNRFKFVSYMKSLSIAIFFLLAFVNVFIGNRYSVPNYINDLIFLVTFGFMFIAWYAYLVVTIAHSIKKLFLLVAFAPLLSYVAFDTFLISYAPLHDNLLNNINNTVHSIFIVILCALMINAIVFIVPYENMKEIRVTVQLVIAIFTTLSYIAYISEDIVNYFYLQIVNQDPSITKEQVKEIILYILNVFTLPYLISCVWSLFCIELRDRKHKLQEFNSS